MRQHLNPNAACSSRLFNSDGGFFGWHSPRSWPRQDPVPPAPQRSRPSAFAGSSICLASRLQVSAAVVGTFAPAAKLHAGCSSFQVGLFMLGLSVLAPLRQAVKLGLRGVGGLGTKGRAVVGFCRVQVCWQQVARFSYSWAMSPRSAVLPNPSLKGRSNGVPPSPGHRVRLLIFCGPGLASHRRPPP
jgi:hypothetical protein